MHVFLNQDVCLLNQELETTGFDQFCFREGLKTKSRWLLIVSIFFYIPNVNEFFEGLLSLFQECGRDCVNGNTDGGTQNFLQGV